jgi:hypothetical protein
MDECDPLSFGSDSRDIVDQPDAAIATTLKRRIEIGHGETDVMYSRPPLREKFPYWRVRPFRFEKLHERFPRLECSDSRTVGIGDRNLFQAQDFPVERHRFAQAFEGDSNMSDAGGFGG